MSKNSDTSKSRIKQVDGTLRWLAKSIVRGTIAVAPMMIAIYTVAFFNPNPFWWFVAGSLGSTFTNDYLGGFRA